MLALLVCEYAEYVYGRRVRKGGQQRDAEASSDRRMDVYLGRVGDVVDMRCLSIFRFSKVLQGFGPTLAVNLVYVRICPLYESYITSLDKK